MNRRLPLSFQRFDWPLVVVFQVAMALLLFHDFIFGPKYFAFFDIGSDTFFQFVPATVFMASPANWSSAWSFNFGLGNLGQLPANPYSLLAIAGGPERVLDLRIWVYLAKILTGGLAFHAFLRASGSRAEIAAIGAIAFSFCGFVTTDGQWDPHATEFACYPVVLWAIARHVNKPTLWHIPLAIAFSVYSGIFAFSLGVFVAYAFVAALLVSRQPLTTLSTWLRSVFPLSLAGIVLAAPALLPNVYVLLNSPRITGAQAVFSDRLRELFTLNSPALLATELSGLFHKNLLGVGNAHHGWMNYLEGPGFFVGMLPLLLIPQLWRGSSIDRRMLAAGLAALALFFLAPAVRYAAFGFGLDYFRVNNLWVSLLLLLLFAKALEVVAVSGLHRVTALASVLVVFVSLAFLEQAVGQSLSRDHALRIIGGLLIAILLLAALAWQWISWRRFAFLACLFVAAEAVLVNYPAFHANREVVTDRTPGYNDETMQALAALKSRDPGFYRVEKTYNSVSLCDALAQGYFGVKSYWFQNSSTVGFYSDLNLIPKRSGVKNFTNWLPNFGERFPLYSLMSVKYMLADRTLVWPGFNKIGETAQLNIYENVFALPLGVVYDKQFPRERFMQLPNAVRDTVLLHAAVVDRPLGSSPPVFDENMLWREGIDRLAENYAQPARTLQRRGLAIERFSPGRIVGNINSDVAGLLVFSIPYSKGWSISIDGAEAEPFVANLGMLATQISAGAHRVELRYALPGLLPGIALASIALLAMITMTRIRQRRSCAKLDECRP